ncbi:FAD synthase [Candidatus Bathyarchaeota archaeon]|nr:MAG: FAD synthase [Candidatus Bathyarchaeota archaeon]
MVEEKKHKTVLASGVFDLIHLGHVRFLEKAKEAGGENVKLIVVVARDKTVEKTKGKLPILPEEERRALVESLKPVDVAVLGNDPFNVEDVIQKFKPDIIAFGYDQDKVEEEVKRYVEKEGLSIKTVRIQRFGPEELSSSSKIKSKILSEVKQLDKYF